MVKALGVGICLLMSCSLALGGCGVAGESTGRGTAQGSPPISTPSLGASGDESGASKRRGPFRVVRVSDGDTLNVRMGSEISKVRVIGINTPETVDPRRPVGCFGSEASQQAKRLLTGQSVWLEADGTQDEKDKYGRLLAFVWIDNSTDFGLQMIRDGFAKEYTYKLPYRYQETYRSAERAARKAGVGLWGPSTCAGNTG